MGELGCNAGTYTPPLDQSGSLDRVIGSYGITTTGDFNRKEKWKILRAARDVGGAFSEVTGEPPSDAFNSVYGGMEFVKSDQTCMEALNEECWGSTDERTITIYSDADVTSDGYNNFLVHEMGHAFDNAMGGLLSTGYGARLAKAIRSATNPEPWSPMPSGNAGFAPGWIEGDHTYITEEAADMFLGWVYGTWHPDISGTRRSNWMGLWMRHLVTTRDEPPWLTQYNCNEDDPNGC